MPLSMLIAVAIVPSIMAGSDALGFTCFFWKSKAYKKRVKARALDKKKNPEKYKDDDIDIDPDHGYPRDLL